MTYSYAGLLAAGASEVAVRVPGAAFWWSVLAATAFVMMLGSWLIERRRSVTLARHRDSGLEITA